MDVDDIWVLPMSAGLCRFVPILCWPFVAKAKADRSSDYSKTGNSKSRNFKLSLTELTYRVWRDDSKTVAQLAHDQCLALSIVWIHESCGLLKTAEAMKAKPPCRWQKCGLPPPQSGASHPDSSKPSVLGSCDSASSFAAEGRYNKKSSDCAQAVNGLR